MRNSNQRSSNQRSRNGKSIPAQTWEMALKGLTGSEAQAARLRFGIGEPSPLTVGEVAKRVGMSRERVRQIEERIRSRLRALRPGGEAQP